MVLDRQQPDEYYTRCMVDFEKFILLPINKWKEDYAQVNIGGISCDHSDYYNSEDLDQQIFLPRLTMIAMSRCIWDFFIPELTRRRSVAMVALNIA